jgi:hypothetical protein
MKIPKKIKLESIKDKLFLGTELPKSAQKHIVGGYGDCGSDTIAKFTSNGNGGVTADECDA